MESIEDNMSKEQWWPNRENWPEFPEHVMEYRDGKVFRDRLYTDRAMALLILEEHVIMLNAEGHCGLFVACNDVFYPAADAEKLDPVGFGKDEVFWLLYDLVRYHGGVGAIKWCALKRNLRPMKKYEDSIRDEGLWCERMEALPERDI